MTNPLQDKKLTRDKLRQLIALARKHIPPEQSQTDAADYDWQQPHRFGPEHLAALDTFGKKFAEQIVETFNALCQSEFETPVISITQHFTRLVAAAIPAEQHEHYFLPFITTDNNQCGFIGISPETAIVLVSLMLRDSDIAARDDKKLSQLEETILMDVVTSVVGTFAAALMQNAGPAIQSNSQFVRGKWPLNSDSFKDLTTIALTLNPSEGNLELAFIILSEAIEPVLGIKEKSTQQLSARQIRDVIMRSMNNVPIKVIARFNSASMALNDVMNLAVGDILLLDKKVDEPIELLLNNRPCLLGHPAASLGKYAVVIAPPDGE